ncbi:LysR family transcriptional regulator [Aliikangiella marina]|uniref:LysR family transcriptional regulator n=1 Tax=Aliikangiella marina TaxID=1712262 RepID=A0A545T1M0_9GAMM|nr:LysR family transcriptional regulator [Aliikangiella marina]TQV71113.1 LysR family transcriptional regulator [Aliikangiella marina]
MNKLVAMNMFVRIVETGSLTKAAEALGTSLPTVVRTLANLEEHLTTRLLNRTTRKITLTVEGRNYYERCKKILLDIDEAESALSEQQVKPTGKLKITASTTFGNFILTPLIAQFLKENPQMEVEMLLLDRNIDLIEEGIDVAFRIGDLVDSSMVAIKVAETRRITCASPELLAAYPPVNEPEALSELPCIRFSGFGLRNHWTFYRQGSAFKVPVSGPLTCNQLATTKRMVASGVGVGWFLAYQVNDLIRDGSLSVILQEFEPSPRPINIVFSHAKLMSTRVRVFVDWMKQALIKQLDEASN